MTRRTQKISERQHLEVFRDILRKKLNEAFPDGDLVECESPDFIVKRAGNELGIEVTDLHRAKYPSEQYSQAQRVGFFRTIVEDARRMCEKEAIPPLWVTVWIFPEHFSSQGGDAQRNVSENLARFVMDWCNTHPEELSASLRPGEALPSVWQILVVRGESGVNTHQWQWKPGAHTVAPVGIDQLEVAIARKEGSYEGCRKHCRECWLVLVGNPFDPAKAADIRRAPETAAATYKSRFERVFLLQVPDELIELHLEKP